MGTSGRNLKGLRQIIINNYDIQNTIINNYDIHKLIIKIIPNLNKSKILAPVKYTKYRHRQKCTKTSADPKTLEHTKTLAHA